MATKKVPVTGLTALITTAFGLTVLFILVYGSLFVFELLGLSQYYIFIPLIGYLLFMMVVFHEDQMGNSISDIPNEFVQDNISPYVQKNVIDVWYRDIDYLFHHDLYENLEHIMDKFVAISKFIVGGIFFFQCLRSLYYLYLVTSKFVDIKIASTESAGDYVLLSAYGWNFGFQLFWAGILLAIYYVLKYFDDKRALADSILKHVDD
jgi:hypothetical protein